MDKVVAYLLEKETITGAEMVAIIEGRDPATGGERLRLHPAQRTGFRPSSPEIIEPAAKKVHMISEKIEAPEASPDPERRPTVRINHPLTKHRLTRKPESKQENDSRSE